MAANSLPVPEFLPPDLVKSAREGRDAGLSDDEIINALSQHPQYGERVRSARGAGSSRDVLDVMFSSRESAGPRPPSAKPGRGRTLKGGEPEREPQGLLENVLLGPYGQVGEGVSRIAHAQSGGDVAGGLSDVARGTMGVVAPAVLPGAVITRPLATAVGLVGGTAIGGATELGLKAAGVPSGYAELAGTSAGLGAGLKLGTMSNPRTVDPHIASLRAWNFHKDPRILDQISSGEVKLSSGLSDLQPALAKVVASGEVPKGFINESVLRALPEAKSANRAAWSEWMTRAEGQFRDGEPIVRATMSSLKDNISDPRAQAIIAEASRQFARPLTPRELEGIIIQKNAELKSFYSGSKEVQAAAERAGADTLKTKALLEAQVRTARALLNNMLDPAGAGAGPRELQARYGALAAIEEAANARRTDIISEHPVNPLERAANFHLDPRAAIKARQGSSEWLIENAIQASGAPQPLPRPVGPYPVNPLQLGPGSIRVGPATPDPSSVWSVPGMYPTGPNPARALPPASTRMAPPPDAVPGVHPTTSTSGLRAGTGPTVGPGSPVPLTSESIAARIGKAIWVALGGPGES